MITFIDSAYAEFLYKEKKHRDLNTNESEKEYGQAKLTLHLAIKKTTDALRYYQQGHFDGGRVAHEALYLIAPTEKNCKPCKGEE